jgi:hypothetical protein
MAQLTTRRRSSRPGWLPILLLGVVGVGVVLGTLYLLNDGHMPWTAQAKSPEDDPAHAGLKPYPRAARAIPAFTAVRWEHLIDPKTQKPHVVWLDPKDAGERGLLDTKQVLGRVLRDDRVAGYAFTEKDFLPAGSQDSWTSAIPAGMSGLTVTAAQVPGLRGLKRWDKFRLVAAADVSASAPTPRGVNVPADLQRQTAENVAFSAPTRVLVENGVVINPMPEGRTSTRDEVAVAVPNAQYDELLSALARNAEITCLAQSGNPLVPSAPLPKADTAPEPERLIINNGGKTETILLPPAPKDGGVPQR